MGWVTEESRLIPAGAKYS